MSDMFPSLSTNLTPSFLTTRQLSKNIFDNAFELDKYTKGLTSTYFETWKKDEEDRLLNLISRPTLGLSSSELWTSKLSDTISSNALSNLDSVYGVNNKVSFTTETMDMWKHEDEKLQAVQVKLSEDWQIAQDKFHELVGLGEYDESILNFRKEHESLFDLPVTETSFDTNIIEGTKYLEEMNSTMYNLGLDALHKASEINQPYKIALEQAEAMQSLRGWGEPHEILIDKYSEQVEETTEVIESILNLSELIDDELFDDIFWTDSYDDIKELVYKLLDEGKLEQVFERRLLVQKLKNLKWFKHLKHLTIKDFNYQWNEFCKKIKEEKSVFLKKVEK